jgi:hypothetical protein
VQARRAGPRERGRREKGQRDQGLARHGERVARVGLWHGGHNLGESGGWGDKTWVLGTRPRMTEGGGRAAGLDGFGVRLAMTAW